MSNQDNFKTSVRETPATVSSGSTMPLIVGGLVVAVGFILWLVFGNAGSDATITPASDTTNVTIEQPAAPADTTTNVTIDPAPVAPAEPAAPAPDAVAPADTAPADGAAPATPPANP